MKNPGVSVVKRGMHWFVITCLIISAPACSRTGQEEPSRKDHAALQGEWVIVSAESNGEAPPPGLLADSQAGPETSAERTDMLTRVRNAIMAGQAQAYNGLSSELSHAAGGALAAGATTWVFRDSENRAWIGFAASTALAIYQQGGQIRRGGPKHEQYMDIFSHMAGAAIGAWGTDKYLLLPVIPAKEKQ